MADVLHPEVSKGQLRRRYDETLLGYREMLVAKLDGRVIGTVSTGGWGFQRSNSLRMFALDVGKEFKNRGVGTALIDALEASAISLHLKEVNLEVSVDNVDAIRLYERLGYQRLPKPVTDCWDELDEDGNGRTVKALSWMMTKEMGRTEDDATKAGSRSDHQSGIRR